MQATRYLLGPVGTRAKHWTDVLTKDYDARSPWRDLGAGRTGIEHPAPEMIKFMIHQRRGIQMPKDFAVVALWQEGERICLECHPQCSYQDQQAVGVGETATTAILAWVP